MKGGHSVSREQNDATFFREVQASFFVEYMKSNQRTKLTDVDFQEAKITTNSFMLFLNHVNDIKVIRGRKTCLPSRTFGPVKANIRMAENVPSKSHLCMIRRILLV